MTDPLRILYAEDDPRDADLTQTRCAQDAPDVSLTIVESGEQAWQCILSETYDLLLLDYRLPDMDGLSLLKRLRLNDSRLPVVMVTGLGDEEVVVQALRLGAVDYIPKSGNYLDTLPAILHGLALDARRKRARLSHLSATRRHVLYVERHAMDIDLTQQHLADVAPQVALTVVATCREALDLLTQPADFDLVLIDLRMPDMSGLDFLRELKHRGLSVPCIVITGQGDEETAIAALKLGAADYVVKRNHYLLHLPFAIEHAIEHYQLDRTNAALRVSEHSFRLLFANNPHPMWVYDLVSLRFLEVNDAAIDQYGYSRDEFLALNLLAIRPSEDAERLLADVQRPRPALQHSGEWQHRLKDGRIIDVEITSHTLDFDGRAAALVVAQDITHRKRAEHALQESETRYRAIFNGVRDGILVETPDGRISDANASACQLYGCTRDELCRKQVTDLVPSGQPITWLGVPERDRLAGPIETLNLRANGELFPVEISGQQQVIDGQAALLIVVRDITERKHVADALRASEERYRLLFNTSLDAILLTVPDGRILAANPAACQMFGRTEDALKQVGRSGVVDVNDPRLAAALAERNQTGRFSGELTLIRSDGTLFPGEVTTSMFIDQAGQVRTSMIIRDITERKQAEAALRRSEHDLRRYAQRLGNLHDIDHAMLQAQSPRAIAEASLEHVVQLIPSERASIVVFESATNEAVMLAALPQTDGPSPLLLRQSIADIYGPQLAELEQGQPVIIHDVSAHAGEGPVFQLLAAAGLQRAVSMPLLAHAQLIGVLDLATVERGTYSPEQLAVVQEVADQLALVMHQARLYEQIQRHAVELEERVQARTREVALERERLRAILDAAGEGMVFTNLDGVIEYINPAMEQLTGYTADEALGQNPRIWQSGQTPLAAYERMWSAITDGQTWQGELINRHKDGHLYDVALTAATLTDNAGQIVGFVGVQRDITRQKELDRLKDQFVANVSHELRTPLTSIMLQIDLLERGKAEKHAQYLQVLRREAQRLKVMIEDLLDLSRLDRQLMPLELTSIDLHSLLAALVADRMQAAIERELTLEFSPTIETAQVTAETSMLTQVTSNLITNALNYTPAGGSVTVQTHRQRVAAQDWLTLTVRDTGPGIVARDLPHVFERFYRGEVGRKATAPGTGLGLAISKSIMEQLGGRITVETEPGQGTAFTVWLKPG